MDRTERPGNRQVRQSGKPARHGIRPAEQATQRLHEEQADDVVTGGAHTGEPATLFGIKPGDQPLDSGCILGIVGDDQGVRQQRQQQVVLGLGKGDAAAEYVDVGARTNLAAAGICGKDRRGIGRLDRRVAGDGERIA